MLPFVEHSSMQVSTERARVLQERNDVLEKENAQLREKCLRMTEESNMEKFKCQLLVEMVRCFMMKSCRLLIVIVLTCHTYTISSRYRVWTKRRARTRLSKRKRELRVCRATCSRCSTRRGKKDSTCASSRWYSRRRPPIALDAGCDLLFQRTGNSSITADLFVKSARSCMLCVCAYMQSAYEEANGGATNRERYTASWCR